MLGIRLIAALRTGARGVGCPGSKSAEPVHGEFVNPQERSGAGSFVSRHRATVHVDDSPAHTHRPLPAVCSPSDCGAWSARGCWNGGPLPVASRPNIA